MRKEDTIAVKRCHSFVVIPKSKYRPDKHVLYERPERAKKTKIEPAKDELYKSKYFKLEKKDKPKEEVSADGK